MKTTLFIIGVLFTLGTIIELLTGLDKYKKRIRSLERKISRMEEEIVDNNKKSEKLVSDAATVVKRIKDSPISMEHYAEIIMKNGDLILQSFESLKVKVAALAILVETDEQSFENADAVKKYINAVSEDINIIDKQIEMIHYDRRNERGRQF